MLASLRRVKEGHHAFEASMGFPGRREAESRKGERGEGDKQGEGTSWVILHKASTFL